MEEKIRNLLQQMTLDEKVSMLAGADAWHTVAIPRLGIPAIKVTDGPNGARGTQSRGGPSSASFPVGSAMAATWNPALVRHIGEALAGEVRAKGAHILLAPTVNIHRSPLAGRNFECYSEDPYLAACMAVAYITGLQSQGVGACIKHFVGNDSEFERKSISSDVGVRALHEIYLTPFRIALREAQPWAVMSAYNKLNGTWCSENASLLRDVLKRDWGFDGIVISDWGGTYTPAAAANGLDLEMPGPAHWMGQHVYAALESGALSHEELDDSVCRLLRTVARAGAFDHPELQPERSVDRPEDRALIREAASEAIVLLKNDDRLLPLDTGAMRSIAVIGELAAVPSFQGGGSSHVPPHYIVSPLDAIRAQAGDDIAVDYAPGYTIRRTLPLIDPAWLAADDGTPGALTTRFYDGTTTEGEPVHTGLLTDPLKIWFGDDVPVPDPTSFSVRLSGWLAVPATGRYELGVTTSAPSQTWVGGRPLAGETAAAEHGTRDTRSTLYLEANQPVPLVVEFSWDDPEPWRMFRLAARPETTPPSTEEAVALAARSDVAVVFAGLNDEWESEGFDRPDMALPGGQAELIAAVARANPNTLVVLNVGSPIDMPWLDDVPAVLLAWYLGQETGHAIVDLLFGAVVPSGRLPTTFPRRLRDNPAYLNYPGENGHVLYGEGLFVGYRYYDQKRIEPLFPFGHGLSYTTFAYRDLALDAHKYRPGDEIHVRLDVENTGTRTGKEVVQIYVRDVESRLSRPEKELKAFAKVELEPGETRTVQLTLDRDALAYYDPARGGWLVEPGEFEVWAGGSAADIRLSARFTVVESEPAA
ncbi:MAG: glycoside hydrolase family 3 C-terminal domain-containing protein [Anaerolineae bacterium]|nr:glycoside hydrolase family 3 C-terminal domain-containing protein [Anaerolineae bacterium]